MCNIPGHAEGSSSDLWPLSHRFLLLPTAQAAERAVEQSWEHCREAGHVGGTSPFPHHPTWIQSLALNFAREELVHRAAPVYAEHLVCSWRYLAPGVSGVWK